MSFTPNNPIIVQSDRTVLLEVDNSQYPAARDGLAQFAELEKSPEHIHTYRITPLSLWNAAAAGQTSGGILSFLEQYGKYDVPQNIRADIVDHISRFGRIILRKEDGLYLLTSLDPPLIAEIWHNRAVKPYLKELIDEQRIAIHPHLRGHVKQALIKLGMPVQDVAGYEEGDYLEMALLSQTRAGVPFLLRPYQVEAGNIFHDGGSVMGGSGVIVLPCGAGKTIVGLEIMSRLKTNTLILVTSTVAAHQWMREICDKSTLHAVAVGEYTGEVKEIKPVTISTYQILTYRRSRSSEFEHFSLFNERNWGLIIYDEVHLLPAPVFRITAEIQAKRRLGLTATLVREDGREDDVFSLIGPKKYDVPWKVLEKQGWIATAHCTEIRLRLPEDQRMVYALASPRDKIRLASENPKKLDVVKDLLARHGGEQILIIGHYIHQITQLASELDLPLITGKTPNWEREKLFSSFRKGEVKYLVVSKVGNFAIDLPDANVLIQISGTFGSRQEEAQRLGRILRPKDDGSTAHFYSLVTRDTRDQDFAANRQLFLTEQGYGYEIRDGESS